MKKYLFLAALMAAAIVGMAQNEADSVSVMFRHLQDTNAELARLNNAYNTHAVMVAGGGAIMTVGLLWAKRYEGDTDSNYLGSGLTIAAVGAVVVAASFIPLRKAGVTLDERGLIVRPSELKKKR